MKARNVCASCIGPVVCARRAAPTDLELARGEQNVRFCRESEKDFKILGCRV